MIHFISKYTKKLTLRSFMLGIAVASMTASVLTACVDNDFSDKNYYTATKRTAAQLISDSPERYSKFQQILERANYYNVLSTYGTFTVFAPTNEAVETYLSENGYKDINDIPEIKCDTIARTHIINKQACFTTDYYEGELPMNMDDRYLVLSSDSDVNNNNALLLYVNKRSKLVQKDDSVTNGVVHTIDRLITPSNSFLPDLIAEDSTTTIFGQALKLTNMSDSLTKYMDLSYSVSDDSATIGVPIRYGNQDWKAKYPEKRYHKFTALVEPDAVFKKHNINNINDLIAYAKKVYDKTFPKDAGLYDNDFTNRKNPLNRFISYHLIDGRIGYDDLAPSGEVMKQCLITDVADPEAFWQTMCPGAMIRFCRPSEGLYANRKGLGRKYEAGCQGVKVLSASESGTHEQGALNGVFHYLDNILVYDVNTRDNVLNCRMRIDGTTLSPDFWNAGAVGHTADILTAFKNGYISGWKTSPETFIGVRSEMLWMSSYLANAICVKGQYDVTITLPTPPPGTYEIRLGYVAGGERGVVQVYLNNDPCGIPIDLRVYAGDPTIGVIIDAADEEEDLANDKALHNRGYMRGMDSYRKPGATNFRVDAWAEHMRRILTTTQVKEGQELKLRFRQVLEGNAEWSFDYIELCPKSVYASPAGEDTH